MCFGLEAFPLVTFCSANTGRTWKIIFNFCCGQWPSISSHTKPLSEQLFAYLHLTIVLSTAFIALIRAVSNMTFKSHCSINHKEIKPWVSVNWHLLLCTNLGCATRAASCAKNTTSHIGFSKNSLREIKITNISAIYLPLISKNISVLLQILNCIYFHYVNNTQSLICIYSSTFLHNLKMNFYIT